MKVLWFFVRIRNRIVRYLSLNKLTRPAAIRYFVWRYGNKFLGTYDGIPVIKTNYLDIDKGG